MTLEEVGYMIDGTLKIEDAQTYGGIGGSTVTLVDANENICIISARDGARPSVGAGKTVEEARNDLAKAMKGKLLFYLSSEISTANTEILQIPPTLVGEKANPTEPEIVETSRDCTVDRLLRLL